VFAGALGTEGQYDHDALLVLLPAPWKTGGAYAASNNALELLARIALDREVGESYVVVGAFAPRTWPSVRVVLSRPGLGDEDRDGLSADVEAALGTCDREPSGPGECRSPDPLPPGFSPTDTDNDGLTDLEEVWGVRRCYPALPEAPYGAVPPCIKDSEGRCVRECGPSAAFAATLPVSAMEAPDPTVQDVYVEYDYWQSGGPDGVGQRLPDARVSEVKDAFERRWEHDGGKPGFDSEAPLLKLHFVQDDAVPAVASREMGHIPATASRYLFFDLFFDPDRKYTNVFHYVVGVPRGAGQSDVAGRAAIVGDLRSASGPPRLIHEMGHLLSLMHHFDSARPSNSPFYLSIMSYGYAHTLPEPVEWNGVFERCGSRLPCREYFKCSRVTGMGSVCVPDCGIVDSGEGKGRHFSHFSSGGLLLPEDTSEAGTIPETGFPEWFLPYLYCYTDATRGPSTDERVRRFVHSTCAGRLCVQCESGTCAIDWDRDGDFGGAQDLDLDQDGEVSDARLADHDDHRRILERARTGLRPTEKKTIAAFYTDFAKGGGNVLPYPAVVVERHGGTVEDVTNLCDEAAVWSHCRKQLRRTCAFFRGAASRDRSMEVKFRPESCLRLESGLAVSIRVKPLSVEGSEIPAAVFDSEMLTLQVRTDGEELTWEAVVRTRGGGEEVLELADSGALGRWTRLTFIADNGASKMKFLARRGTTRLETGQSGRIRGTLCGFDVGARAGSIADFIGFIDDPMVLSGPVPEL
jgi:hypothetical protein